MCVTHEKSRKTDNDEVEIQKTVKQKDNRLKSIKQSTKGYQDRPIKKREGAY